MVARLKAGKIDLPPHPILIRTYLACDYELGVPHLPFEVLNALGHSRP